MCRLLTKQQQSRDPRFLAVAGEFSSEKFNDQYSFLPTMHEEEHKTLRDNLKKARKLLDYSPQDLRAEREEEVKNLESALKRAESAVNSDKRKLIEREALQKVAREEKERRKRGKGAWFMKNGLFNPPLYGYGC
jgi:ribosomal RNA-processing protein 36